MSKRIANRECVIRFGVQLNQYVLKEADVILHPQKEAESYFNS